jgi:RNA-splicing ligase RtcB
MIELTGKYTTAKIFIDNVEEEVISQIYSIINSPISKGLKVRIQPDAHFGKGICIGFTMELGNYLTPSYIGVDIGCGLISGKFPNASNLDLEKINKEIRHRIPMGFNEHKSPVFTDIPYNDVQIIADKFVKAFNVKYNTNYVAPLYSEQWLIKKLKDIKMNIKKFFNSIGSMGGGNHFLEIGVNQALTDYYVTIHSGSRNFGLKVAEYWINQAKKQMNGSSNNYSKRLNEIVLNTVDKKEIPNKIDSLKKKFGIGIDREYLQDEYLINYLFDMIFAQQYAVWNRKTMLDIIQEVLNITKFDEVIESIHNYVDFNDFIIRKGAIASYKDKKMIIPFNMRDGMVIAVGKSNPDWNYSCAHGAGRIMSRTKAKETVNLDDFKKSMEGIYSTSVCKGTLDESPQSYKDSELIELLLEPTIEIIDRVKPILNIKDSSEGESWKDRKANKKMKQEREERKNNKKILNL